MVFMVSCWVCYKNFKMGLVVKKYYEKSYFGFEFNSGLFKDF